MFPELIYDGRIYISEPPLYRVDDKKNPFVINKADYLDRYVKSVTKDYKVGRYVSKHNIEYFDKKDLIEFLSDTSTYVDDMSMLQKHYQINDRLLEIILEEFSMLIDSEKTTPEEIIMRTNIQHLMDRIGEEFKELQYDDTHHEIKGSIDAKMQLIEISTNLVKRSMSIIKIMNKYHVGKNKFVLLDIRTKSEYDLSLLGILKMLKKYQPTILHRFKGLGENDDEDIKETIMDPNTRTLIRVNIEDIENDAKIFQLLRGKTTADKLGRKTMMREYQIDPALIDT
jgi:DNA gyrase/topoisomerase IV subunit B